MFDDADYCMCNAAVAKAFCAHILSSADGARADQCSIAGTLGRQNQDFAHTRKICNKIHPPKNQENPAARRKANERQTKGSFRSWCAHWPIWLNLVFRWVHSIPVLGPYSCAGVTVLLCWDYLVKRIFKVNERQTKGKT